MTTNLTLEPNLEVQEFQNRHERRRSAKLTRSPETAVLLPIEEFRQFVPISRSSIYALIRKNELKTVMVGNRRMVPRSEVNRLANGQTLEAA